MKLHASQREIKDNGYYILSIGYCEMQFILRPFKPFSYCSGIYGWNCDNYEINTEKHSIILSTGYSPINNKNINDIDYKIIRKYDDKAANIYMNNEWKTANKKVIKLMYKFIDKEIFGGVE